jgi:biopolymer transport protein ExbB/TolQ
MHASYWIILAIGILEVALLIGVVAFFLRLRRSEELLVKLQQNNREFLRKIEKSSELEQQFLDNFAGRQSEFLLLDKQLAERERELRQLLQQAEGLSQSPSFLRQIILSGHNKGKSTEELARSTGLSVEEVEIILEQAFALNAPKRIG